MKGYIWRYTTGILLAVWMVVVFCFSAQPAEESSEVSGSVAYRLVSLADRLWEGDFTEQQRLIYAAFIDYPVRKAAHMAEFAVLAVLACAFLSSFEKVGRWCYLSAAVFTALYAATDEIHQLFVPGRAGKITDVCIDTIGAVIGLFLLFLCRLVYRRWQLKTRLTNSRKKF